jgi:hypothetical protein
MYNSQKRHELYLRQRARLIELGKNHYQDNKERLKKYALVYYRSHKEKINQRKREKRRLNPDFGKRIYKQSGGKPTGRPKGTGNKIHKIPLYPNGQREKDLMARYKLSWEEYQKLIAQCGNSCPLCGKKETRRRKDGTIYPLHIDHDHKTSKVRGLLCNKCNACLGLIDDNVEILKKMIEYLEK